MNCPHCGGAISDKWMARMIAENRCVSCGEEKTAADGNKRRCATCRRKECDRMKRGRTHRPGSDITEQNG